MSENNWLHLKQYQLDAIRKMKNGCILCGNVGSGKSRTALGYFYSYCGGDVFGPEFDPLDINREGGIPDLYIITTAKKRDSLDWDKEMIPFLLSTNIDVCQWKNKVVVDSWNNVSKYTKVANSFFMFDEQRVVGNGAWVNSFLSIAKKNAWILLSATPGDTWTDYIPVFIANGFYKNRTEFNRQHVIFKPFRTYREVDRYVGTKRLERLRDRILVDMEYQLPAEVHDLSVIVEYDRAKYREINRTRWNPWENRPIETAAEYCGALRRVVNEDISRQNAILDIFEQHNRLIVFYNYNYELDILRSLPWGNNVEVAEWNGQKHQDIPASNKWVYLVQYIAGAEGWNCIRTDTIAFYSQNYSYKTMVQAAGRINRMNTPYSDLYLYHIRSRAGIDNAIEKALIEKKKFNEGKFYRS